MQKLCELNLDLEGSNLILKKAGISGDLGCCFLFANDEFVGLYDFDYKRITSLEDAPPLLNSLGSQRESS